MPPQAATFSQVSELTARGFGHARTADRRRAFVRAGLVAIFVAGLAVSVVSDRLNLLGVGMAAAAALALLGFAGVRLAARWPALRGAMKPRFVVAGVGGAAEAGALQLDGTSIGHIVGSYQLSEMGGRYEGFAGLHRAISCGDVDGVVLVASNPEAPSVDAAIDELAVMAVDVLVYDERRLLDAPQDARPRPVRTVRRPLGGWRMVVKDVEDRVLGGLLLILFLPLLLLIAAGVKLSSPGPAIFKQKRHGYRGREILVYKFRTMRVDMTDHSGGNQTRRDDPRVTRLGHFLRASSLDELPQLMNVVRGDMSLVGPRPHPVGMRTNGLLCHDIVDNYDSRHRVRPGITGWAQINGYRGATTKREQVEGRVRLDNDYIENWSLILDFRIMLLTGVCLFADENAY